LQLVSIPYHKDTRSIIQAIQDSPGLIWFHNGLQAGDTEWFSAWPTETLEYLGNQQTKIISFNSNQRQVNGDWFEILKEKHSYHQAVDSVPFSGGLAGHLSYDLGLEQHNIRSKFNHLDTPLAVVGLYDWCCHVDHKKEQAFVIIQPHCPDEIRENINYFIKKIIDYTPINGTEKLIDIGEPWYCNMEKSTYKEAFHAIHNYIINGDVYQANLTRQWQVNSGSHSDWALYSQLLNEMPAPFSVFHRNKTHSLLSVSPERFIQIEDDKLLAQPIKGTRPRGLNDIEDRDLRDALINSEKDKAENLMIVDLLRNDLAKNAAPGSVKVDKLFEVQSFKNVHHLVSTVSAKLKKQSHPIDVIRDAFPGGSITGAPKKRAMEVIDELETVPRGNYCGCSFFLSGDGYLDSNILIRSLTLRNDTLSCSGGGGIVFDSEFKSEYEESEVKVSKIMKALTP